MLKLHIIVLLFVAIHFSNAAPEEKGGNVPLKPFVLSSPVSEEEIKNQHTYVYRILKYILKQQKRSLVIQKYSTKRSIILANKGLVDGEMARLDNADKQFPNIIKVPSPLLKVSFMGYTTNKKLAKEIKKLEDVKNLKVGYIDGWSTYENLNYKYEPTKVKGPRPLMEILFKKRIEVALLEKSYGDFIIRRQKLQGQLFSTPVFKNADIYLYVHKKHKNMVQPLSRSIEEFKKKYISY